MRIVFLVILGVFLTEGFNAYSMNGAKITAEAIKEAAEHRNNYQLALSLLGWKKGINIFGSLTEDPKGSL